jgi:hypothetical protein
MQQAMLLQPQPRFASKSPRLGARYDGAESGYQFMGFGAMELRVEGRAVGWTERPEDPVMCLTFACDIPCHR